MMKTIIVAALLHSNYYTQTDFETKDKTVKTAIGPL